MHTGLASGAKHQIKPKQRVEAVSDHDTEDIVIHTQPEFVWGSKKQMTQSRNCRPAF
jgi:hypothetical protein